MKKITYFLFSSIAIATQLFAEAPAATTHAAKKGGLSGLLLPMLILFAIWYFLLIMPQQKKEKKRKAMIAAIKKGDKVVTIGGIHGTVEKIQENIITLKTGTSTMDFTRSAISQAGIEKKSKK